MSLLRTFVATDIHPIIQKSIQKQVSFLRNILGDSSIRWVPVHNIHITLKFLGDVSPAKVDELQRIVKAEADSHSSFDIHVNELGSFPSSKRARVLFIGIQASAALEALQQGIESACVKVGFKSETRPFSPHLTIGRVRQGISKHDQQKIYEILRDVKIDSLGTASVDSVHLYKSERQTNGAVYTKLFSAPLHNK
jgi:RNA 2',3'-cyclic 3'-phosphodiesterase